MVSNEHYKHVFGELEAAYKSESNFARVKAENDYFNIAA
jgi:hypothetical protein